MLHNLILCQACGLGFHRIVARSLVFDEGQSKWATTVLVSRKLFDCSIGTFSGVKSNNTGTSRSTIWLILDFSLLNLSDGSEEFNKIFVTGRPRKLPKLSAGDIVLKAKYLRCEHR
jgi:hypothetical protein